MTINFDNESNRPFEVFCALGKAGSVESAHLEAIARLVSMSLRTGVDPDQIVEQLRGITDEPVWDGGTLVRSVPDAISLVLNKYITDKPTADAPAAQIGLFPSTESVGNGDKVTPAGPLTGKRCPECSAYLVAQEGCLNLPRLRLQQV